VTFVIVKKQAHACFPFFFWEKQVQPLPHEVLHHYDYGFLSFSYSFEGRIGISNIKNLLLCSPLIVEEFDLSPHSHFIVFVLDF